jgi:hypothetical protein
MSKVTFTLIAALLIISASCEFNFLERRTLQKSDLAGFNPAELVQIYSRFIDGTQIFANIIDKDACDINAYPEIIGDVIFIINSIKQFDLYDNVPEQIVEILKRIEDIIPRLPAYNDRCSAYQAQALQKLKNLKAYFSKDQYLQILLRHTMFNLQDLTLKFQTLTQQIKDKNYVDAAESFGVLLRASAFWDFN